MDLLSFEYSNTLKTEAENFLMKCFQDKGWAESVQPIIFDAAFCIIEGTAYFQPNNKKDETDK